MGFIKKYTPLLLIWLYLTSTSPFIFYSWPGHPYKLLTFACLLVMIIALFWKKRITINKGIFISSLLLIIFFILENFRASSNEGIVYAIQIIAFFISIIFILNFIESTAFTKSYLWIIALMGIGGTLTFFIHFIIGINPIFSVNYSDGGTSYFMGLTCTNSMYIGNRGFIRYSGFFDEPGAYALYASFALILNKLSINNKRIEIILSIVPLFTLSLAFFIFIVLYQIFFNVKKGSILIFLLFILSLGLIYTYLKSDTDSLLYSQTLGRLEIDNSKGIKGNTRAIQQAADKKTFLDNILIGKGLSNRGGANMYAVLAKHGIIGTIFYYSLLLYFMIKLIKIIPNKAFCFKILILISLSFFHRPELTSSFGLIVIATMIISINKEDYFNENKLVISN